MLLGFDGAPSCDECDEWLTGRQTRWCSPRCKMRARRREAGTLPAEKVCVLCGATFRPLRGKQTYCDYDDDADPTCCQMQNERVGHLRALENERWDKACEHCGENAGWEGVGRARRF